MMRILCLVFVGLCFAMPSTVTAGFLVKGGSLSLPAGGDGHLDVTISNDNGDSLASFFDTFVISGPGLEFATGPGEPDDLQLTSAAYVFPLNDSVSAAFPPAGIIGGTTYFNDTYFGFDATISGSGVVVPSTGALLVKLHVIATTAQPGDVFTISLDRVNSSFIDADFNSVEFTDAPSEIRIVGSAPVPEPPSFTLFALGALAMGVFARSCNLTRGGELRRC
ncbi:MAG: hypothetical protein ACT4QC_05585 [Planctomycetaceae bacterium]